MNVIKVSAPLGPSVVGDLVSRLNQQGVQATPVQESVVKGPDGHPLFICVRISTTVTQHLSLAIRQIMGDTKGFYRFEGVDGFEDYGDVGVTGEFPSYSPRWEGPPRQYAIPEQYTSQIQNNVTVTTNIEIHIHLAQQKEQEPRQPRPVHRGDEGYAVHHHVAQRPVARRRDIQRPVALPVALPVARPVARPAALPKPEGALVDLPQREYQVREKEVINRR